LKSVVTFIFQVNLRFIIFAWWGKKIHVKVQQSYTPTHAHAYISGRDSANLAYVCVAL